MRLLICCIPMLYHLHYLLLLSTEIAQLLPHDGYGSGTLQVYLSLAARQHGDDNLSKASGIGACNRVESIAAKRTVAYCFLVCHTPPYTQIIAGPHIGISVY
ncbi:hypothetical protein F5Y10DRAFT_244908 [Nemania abortiva]|nr:hypothetical protein F5Y10DRAFT_244908 [Nemania abortiva]